MSRFKIKKSGINDTRAGLIWSKELHRSLNWEEATEYCGNLNENGQSDWRLPTVEELQTIIDRKESNPAVPQELKDITQVLPYGYWSSTTVAYYSSFACSVFLSNGFVSNDDRNINYYVWPVRGEMK